MSCVKLWYVHLFDSTWWCFFLWINWMKCPDDWYDFRCFWNNEHPNDPPKVGKIHMSCWKLSISQVPLTVAHPVWLQAFCFIRAKMWVVSSRSNGWPKTNLTNNESSHLFFSQFPAWIEIVEKETTPAFAKCKCELHNHIMISTIVQLRRSMTEVCCLDIRINNICKSCRCICSNNEYNIIVQNTLISNHIKIY